MHNRGRSWASKELKVLKGSPKSHSPAVVRVNKAELRRRSKAGLAAGLGPPRGWCGIFGRTLALCSYCLCEFAAKHLMVCGGVTVGQQGRQSQSSGEEQGRPRAWLPLGVPLPSSSQQWPSERDG